MFTTKIIKRVNFELFLNKFFIASLNSFFTLHAFYLSWEINDVTIEDELAYVAIYGKHNYPPVSRNHITSHDPKRQGNCVGVATS